MKKKFLPYLILVVAAFALTQNSTSALASTLIFNFHQAVGSDSTYDLELGDLNGDGHLDAFAANSEGNCLGDLDTYWLNDGNANFEFGGDLGAVRDSHAVDLGDLDADGDLDAIIGVDFGPPANLVYLNDGDANFTYSQSLGNSQTYDLELGDLDGDGDLDVIFANWYGSSDEVWFNDGTGTFYNTGQALADNYSISIKLGDLDGDHDLDAFIGKWAEDEIWLNNGSGYFIDSGQRIAAGRSEDLALGDLDLDGDLDAVVVFQNSETEIYFNDGVGTFSKSEQELYMLGTRGVALGDLDLDGDLDAVFANDYAQNNTAWLNDGSGNFTNSAIYLGYYTAAQDVKMADLDQDGDLDLFFANYTNDQANHVWINDTVPPNNPPIVEAGGPYDVYEGHSVILTAVGSDPDGDPIDYAWDLDGDGIFEYVGESVLLSAADLDGPETAMVVTRVTDPFGMIAEDVAFINVQNANPTINSINGPLDPVPLGSSIQMNAVFSDDGLADTHLATWNWGNENTSSGTVIEGNGEGQVSDTYAYAQPGVYEIKLTILDDDGGFAETSYRYAVVFDPDGGFVTGGGKIFAQVGSYLPDPSLGGEANFGFVAKYHKVTHDLTGQTIFQFKIAELKFKSDRYDWLVVNQNTSNAQFKGQGTINDELAPNGEFYRFMVWAGDDVPDSFRIKIWWESEDQENVIFDNGPGQAITNGNITIHDG